MAKIILPNGYSAGPLHNTPSHRMGVALQDHDVDQIFALLWDSYPQFAKSEDPDTWKNRLLPGADVPLEAYMINDYDGKLVGFTSADLFRGGNRLIGYSCTDKNLDPDLTRNVLAASKAGLIRTVREQAQAGHAVGLLVQEHTRLPKDEIKS